MYFVNKRLKFLRNSDRALNEHCYPNLFYPELYLLEGGYKSFYESFKIHCEPQTYKPMLHEAHQYDYKHFRAKAKSWEVSRQHIVYKYNEHLQRQRSLHTQKEHESELTEEAGCKESNNRRIIKMKTNFWVLILFNWFDLVEELESWGFVNYWNLSVCEKLTIAADRGFGF